MVYFDICMSVRVLFFVFFFKQKTAYEMRISDWSSDVCSSDLRRRITYRVGAGIHLLAPIFLTPLLIMIRNSRALASLGINESLRDMFFFRCATHMKMTR